MRPPATPAISIAMPRSTTTSGFWPIRRAQNTPSNVANMKPVTSNVKYDGKPISKSLKSSGRTGGGCYPNAPLLRTVGFVRRRGRRLARWWRRWHRGSGHVTGGRSHVAGGRNRGGRRELGRFDLGDPHLGPLRREHVDGHQP